MADAKLVGKLNSGAKLTGKINAGRQVELWANTISPDTKVEEIPKGDLLLNSDGRAGGIAPEDLPVSGAAQEIFNAHAETIEALDGRTSANETAIGETAESVEELAGRVSGNTSAIGVLAGNVLTKNNETRYIPTGQYNPATKEYVDNAVAEAGGGDMLAAVYDQAGGKKQVAFRADLQNPSLLLNGYFDSWSSGTSFVSTSADRMYTADHWFTESPATKVSKSGILSDDMIVIGPTPPDNTALVETTVLTLESIYTKLQFGYELPFVLYGDAVLSFSITSKTETAVLVTIYDSLGGVSQTFLAEGVGVWRRFSIKVNYLTPDESATVGKIVFSLPNEVDNYSAHSYKVAGVKLEYGDVSTGYQNRLHDVMLEQINPEGKTGQYQTEADARLGTEDKTVVGAINELNSGLGKDFPAATKLLWSVGGWNTGSVAIPGVSQYGVLVLGTNVGTITVFKVGNTLKGLGGTKNISSTNMFVGSVGLDISGDTLTIRQVDTGYIQLMASAGNSAGGAITILSVSALVCNALK